MIRPIYIYGAAVLREVAQPVDLSKKEEIDALVTDLKDTLKCADGCGLAAPQIGVGKRVVIVDGEGLEETYPYLEGFKRTLINPEVIEESDKMCSYDEGCLSVPGIYASVSRPSSIKLRYYDEQLNSVEEVFDKFGCRMIQHELSHLEGELFVDKVAPIRKKMLSNKLQGIARGKVSTSYKIKQ